MNHTDIFPVIGEGYGPANTTRLLTLHFKPVIRRFMLAVRNRGADNASPPVCWGTFATQEQMQAHYLEHPLARMGNQALSYHLHLSAAQPVTVKKHDATRLHVHIANPDAAAPPYTFLVRPGILKLAVTGINLSLARAPQRPALRLVQGGLSP